MRILGVLDVLAGLVVRGIAGRRQEYRPLVSALCSSTQPADVARALVEQFGLDELYLADLDAIAGKEPAWEVYEAVKASGAQLWIDAGVRTLDEALRLRAVGTVVVGLETVAGPGVVAAIVEALGVGMVFSLDLRAGIPLGETRLWNGDDAEAIARQAIALGVRRLLVLDLANVGVGQGTGTEECCARFHRDYPEIEILAGGGVRGREDLQRLRVCGVRGVLVASALHDGRLTRADVS